MSEEVKESKSIVDPERRKEMKGARDWLGHFMEDQALTKGVGAKPAVPAVEEQKDENGNVIVEGKPAKPATKGKDVWDLDLMFVLAERNGIDTTHKTFVGIREQNAVGRARMTLHNMLLSRAKKRFGLFDVDGNWVDLPEDEIRRFELTEPTETRDGVKIKKEKPAKQAEEAVEG